jgi:hypothetical protein
VSSYACVYLSDGRPVCSFRNGVDQLFFILFTRDEWIELDGPEAWRLVSDHYGLGDEDEAHVTGFRTTVGVLRDRLDLVGVPVSAVSSELVRLATERAEMLDGFGDIGLPEEAESERKKEIEYLTNLTWEDWITGLRSGLQAGLPVTRWGQREPLGTPARLMSLWDDHDARYQLRAVLEALPRAEEITLDLDDLFEGGWLETSVDPREHANALVAYTSQGGLPPIVLTEGRFDVEVLTTALRLRRPHLVGYIRFPDFNQKNEGGAAALRQTVRAFASAGIPNRVVAVFDNDTAARDVLRSFPTGGLPSNLLVTRLPELELARDYPTVGPQGEHSMDVNGLATSIEMYLGTDVLVDEGEMRPVLWGGYVKRLAAYQGDVSDKEGIHERWRQKAARATASPELMADQDWAALDQVLDHILDLLRGAVLERSEAANGPGMLREVASRKPTRSPTALCKATTRCHSRPRFETRPVRPSSTIAGSSIPRAKNLMGALRVLSSEPGRASRPPTTWADLSCTPQPTGVEVLETSLRKDRPSGAGLRDRTTTPTCRSGIAGRCRYPRGDGEGCCRLCVRLEA